MKKIERENLWWCKVAYEGSYFREAYQNYLMKKEMPFLFPFILLCSYFLVRGSLWIKLVCFVLAIGSVIMNRLWYEKKKKQMKALCRTPRSKGQQRFFCLSQDEISLCDRNDEEQTCLVSYDYAQFHTVLETERLLVLYGKEGWIPLRKNQFTQGSVETCKEFLQQKIR